MGTFSILIPLLLAIAWLGAVLSLVFLLVFAFLLKSLPLKLAGGIALVSLLFLTFVAVVWWFAPRPELPLTEQAAELVELPPSAVVTKVFYGSWVGDGWVEFRLPTTKNPDEWVTEIWDANLPADAMNNHPSWNVNHPLHKDLRYGENHRSLEYDPASGIYTYSVILGI